MIEARPWLGSGRPIALLALVVIAVAACTAPRDEAAPAPASTATTIVTAGSPCAPTYLEPVLFQQYVSAMPSATPRPAFGGTSFSGLGRVVALAPDGTSLVVELVDLQLRQFGPTTVKVTPATTIERHELGWAIVAAGGVPAGAVDLPLRPGAPAVDAGQHVVVECHRSAGGVGEGTVIAAAAPPGASAWRLANALGNSWPVGTLAWYDKVTRLASLADLRLALGETVSIDLAGTSGDYRATRLANAGMGVGYKG